MGPGLLVSCEKGYQMQFCCENKKWVRQRICAEQSQVYKYQRLGSPPPRSWNSCRSLPSFIKKLTLKQITHRFGSRAWRACLTLIGLFYKIGVRAKILPPTRFNYLPIHFHDLSCFTLTSWNTCPVDLMNVIQRNMRVLPISKDLRDSYSQALNNTFIPPT